MAVLGAGVAEHGLDVGFDGGGNVAEAAFVAVDDVVAEDAGVGEADAGVGSGDVGLGHIGIAGLERGELQIGFIGLVGRFGAERGEQRGEMFGEQVEGLAGGGDAFFGGFGFGGGSGGSVGCGGGALASGTARALYLAVDAAAVFFHFGGGIGGGEGIDDAGGQRPKRGVAGLPRPDGLLVSGHLGVDVLQAAARAVEDFLQGSDLQRRIGRVVLGAVAAADGDKALEVGHIAGVAGFGCGCHDSVVL